MNTRCNMRNSGFAFIERLAVPFTVAVLAAIPCNLAYAQQKAAEPEAVSVAKIWDEAPHNAFTDLVRFRGDWYCTFREDVGHVGGDGNVRIIVSEDGESWESAGLLSDEGVDLRGPKLSVTSDERLMVIMGGSFYEGRELVDLQPRVSFSDDGASWLEPTPVLERGDFPYRVTWHKGKVYGFIYIHPGKAERDDGEWGLKLVVSENGLDFTTVKTMEVPGYANECTVRFMPDDEMVALLRRDPDNAYIGTSMPPYTEWEWNDAGHRLGGPNFVRLPDGSLWAAGRIYPGDPDYPEGEKGSLTMLLRMTETSLDPVLLLPSGGDNSYPGMVWHDGLLWVSYYSSHEDKTSIYLAKIRIPGFD